MSDDIITFARDGHVATLTLNRPQAANAINRATVAALQAALDTVAKERDVRALILTGAGERHFCAGADLKERATMRPDEVPVFLLQARAVMDQLASLRCPTLAAINGAALGGGLELALACDLRVAAQTAYVGLTETALAVIPGAGGTQRLPRCVGVSRAKELIYTARHVEAEEALRIGLVIEVVPAHMLLARVHDIARIIANNGPVAVAQAKQAIDRGMELPLAKALDVEQECYRPTLETQDRLEALQAFKEKRRPTYRGE